MITCSCTASYSGLPASWAFIHQEIFLVIISSKKEVETVNFSEEGSRHFNEMSVISHLI